MPKFRAGQLAPDFILPDQNGREHSLSNYRGKWVLLYFYPKDDTPGCTKEACGIRDVFPKFGKLKAEIFGVSVDSVKSHRKFAEKYKLPFILLADEGKKVVKQYGVWAKKKFTPHLFWTGVKRQPSVLQSKKGAGFMGREYMGTLRTSFLIDPQGKIAKVYESVKPEKHAEKILEDLKSLTN